VLARLPSDQGNSVWAAVSRRPARGRRSSQRRSRNMLSWAKRAACPATPPASTSGARASGAGPHTWRAAACFRSARQDLALLCWHPRGPGCSRLVMLQMPAHMHAAPCARPLQGWHRPGSCLSRAGRAGWARAARGGGLEDRAEWQGGRPPGQHHNLSHSAQKNLKYSSRRWG